MWKIWWNIQNIQNINTKPTDISCVPMKSCVPIKMTSPLKKMPEVPILCYMLLRLKLL